MDDDLKYQLLQYLQRENDRATPHVGLGDMIDWGELVKQMGIAAVAPHIFRLLAGDDE
jgi:hypothetical protein